MRWPQQRAVAIAAIAAASCSQKNPLEFSGEPTPGLFYDFTPIRDAGPPRDASVGTCEPLAETLYLPCRLSRKRMAEYMCSTFGMPVHVAEQGEWLHAGHADFHVSVWYGPDFKPTGCGSRVGLMPRPSCAGVFPGHPNASAGVLVCNDKSPKGGARVMTGALNGVVTIAIDPCEAVVIHQGESGWYDCPGRIGQLHVALQEKARSCRLTTSLQPGFDGFLKVDTCETPAELKDWRQDSSDRGELEWERAGGD